MPSRYNENAYIRGMSYVFTFVSMVYSFRLLLAAIVLCLCTSCVRFNSNAGSDALSDSDVLPEATLADTAAVVNKDSVAPRKRLPTLREQMQRIEEQQAMMQKDIEFIKNDIAVLKDEVVQLREAVTTGKLSTLKTDAVKGPVRETEKTEGSDPLPATLLLSDEDTAKDAANDTDAAKDTARRDEPKKKLTKSNRQAEKTTERAAEKTAEKQDEKQTEKQTLKPLDKTPATVLQSDESTKKATAKPAATAAEQPVPTSDTYKEAMSLIAKKDYAKAVPLLETVLNNDKNPVTRGNAYYWLGEAAYAGTDYNKAIDHFKNAFSIKSSTKADDALLMIAESYRKLGNNEEAKKAYNKLIQTYPQSEFIARARKMLQMM